jgi:hypothetical protein
MWSAQKRQAASCIFWLVTPTWAGYSEAIAPKDVAEAGNTATQVGAGQEGKPGADQLRYRVNYRPADSEPWQLYSETRSLAKANSMAFEMKEAGYQAQVVDDLTPAPQPYPDASETSASNYYPTSNWASDYNYYVVPGRSYNYGSYGGWNPGYGYRSYPNYCWNGGSSWNSGSWRGHYWNNGWRRGEGWNSSHRYWNNSHVDRGTHLVNHERHSQNAHHMYHAQHVSAGHHTPGHHAAARHSSNASYAHRGTGHRAAGARTAGHHTVAHRAAGHAARGHVRRGGAAGHPNSPGRNAAGHHGRHLDP